MKHKIICGKSEEILKQYDDNFFDSCVTDPPYGLEFMGKDWDKFKDGKNIAGGTVSTGEGSYWKERPNLPSFYQMDKKRFGKAGEEGDKDLKLKKNFKTLPRFFTSDLFAFQEFTYQWAIELYRVMKPGAFILVFGGTRTYHRMACAIEDAGFEVRDMIEWFYGSGFPKSLDISKQLDKMAGKEREIIGQSSLGVGSWLLPHKQKHRAEGGTGIGYADGSGKEFDITVPSSEEAIQWNGWGTALKPAHEPILLARKPISEKNVASNVLKQGTGGLNINACRIEHNEPVKETDRDSRGASWNDENCGFRNEQNKLASASPLGRFPTNLILECCCDESVENEIHEPILLARKPIDKKNVASNILEWSVGGLNIESCRVGSEGGTRTIGKGSDSVICYGNGLNTSAYETIDKGRFPTNLILGCCCKDDELIEGKAKGNQGHWSKTKTTGFGEFGGGKSEYDGVGKKDDMTCLIHTNPNCVCKILDDQSGELISKYAPSKATGKMLYGIERKGISKVPIDNVGGASRFFYQAKASPKEKWFYCTICKEAFQVKERDNHIHDAPEKTKYQHLEFHPTQKPEKLIEYLVRLITPPNGTIIEPFMGTGTTLIASEREGFNSVGIDSKSEYCQISYKRLENEISQQTKLTGEQSTIERIGF